MLKRKYRLIKDYDFQQVKRKGRRLTSSLFFLSWVPNSLKYSRFGFIASKKNANAARRNRAVRLLREVVRLNLSKIRTGFDLVLIVRLGIMGKSFGEVEKELKRLLLQAKLMGVENAKLKA